MGNFIVLAALLQQLVQIVRKRYPKLDGAYVLAAAAVVGIVAVYLIPGARVASTLTGYALNEYVNVFVSGLMMGVGMSLIRDIIKAFAESIQPQEPPVPSEEIP